LLILATLHYNWHLSKTFVMDIISLTSLPDWLMIYCFTYRSRIFHLIWYGDVTIVGEGLQNLGICLTLRAFKQGGVFILPHLLWHRTLV
jgi:hypothetical protein